MDEASGSSVDSVDTEPSWLDVLLTDYTAEYAAEPDSDCEYIQPPIIRFRFYYVTIFGSLIASIAIIENLLLFYLFASKKHHRTSYNVYMMLLAVFDAFVSIAYIPLMAVNVLGDYLEQPWLVMLWYSYMRPMFTISHIGLTASTFLIVAATFERYCITVNSKQLPWVQKNRVWIATFAIVMGILSKGSTGAEFRYKENKNCTGTMLELEINMKRWAMHEKFHYAFRVWYRNVATVIAPFLILLILNFFIVVALREQPQMSVCTQLAGPAAGDVAKRKIVRRNATKSLVLVVCCYLASNVFNLVATIWENVDKEGQRNGHEIWSRVWVVLIDTISLLSVIACAFRLPILISCQQQLRNEVTAILANFFLFFCGSRRGKGSRSPSDIEEDRRGSGFQKNELSTTPFCENGNGNGLTHVHQKKDLPNGKEYSIDGLNVYFHTGNETLL